MATQRNLVGFACNVARGGAARVGGGACSGELRRGFVFAQRVALLLELCASIGAIGCHREDAARKLESRASARSAPQDAEQSCAITVFAASSLRDVTVDLATEFRKTHPGCTVTQNYAASNKLGLQIEAGAKFDVFLSAAAAPVERTIAAGKADGATKRALFSNQLAVIAHRGEPRSLSSVCDLGGASVSHVAIGQPDAVPAGIYARDYLSRFGCKDPRTAKQRFAFELVEDKLLPMPEVRAVVAVVARQPGTWGFVYKTDVMASKDVESKLLIEGPLAPSIAYYGVLRPSASPDAKAFMALMTHKEGQSVLLKYGFVIGAS
ncbi:MAG: molybdate ABC transporter substrate-binding protein [Polyangiaceae bacterium]